MKHFIVFGLLAIYIVWTLRFAITFNRTDIFFDKKQKRIHNILIWAMPFIWIIIIKTITKPTHGSMKYNRPTSNDGFVENGMGIWKSGDASTPASDDNQ